MNHQMDVHPLTFGVIGCGRIGQVHLHAIDHEPLARLIAVADIDAASAKSAGEAFGVRPFRSAVELIETLHPDAVIICTPPNNHREIAEAALEAGCHVLCEKPIALSVEDSAAMLETAAGARRLLMMASKFRYVQDLIRAKGVMQSGILGEIILLENEFCSRVTMKNRWNARREISGGGVLIDNGSHSIDIVRYLLGPIESANAIFGKRWQELDVEDTCHLFLRAQRGVIASVDLSWSIHKDNQFYVHVYGTEGTLEVGWKGSRYRQSEKLDWILFGTGYDKFQAVGGQLSNFIGTILDTQQPLIDEEDALESVRVMQAAYRSAEVGEWEGVVV